MFIDIRNKVIILQSMQWGCVQPENCIVTFEQLLHAKKGDSFESEPYSLCREAHHEVMVVDQPVYGGRLMATIFEDGYTPEENAEYYQREYSLFMQLPEDCSSQTESVVEEIQEVIVKFPGDDEINESSEESSDEDLFGAETLRKLEIAREQRGQ